MTAPDPLSLKFTLLGQLSQTSAHAVLNLDLAPASIHVVRAAIPSNAGEIQTGSLSCPCGAADLAECPAGCEFAGLAAGHPPPAMETLRSVFHDFLQDPLAFQPGDLAQLIHRYRNAAEALAARESGQGGRS